MKRIAPLFLLGVILLCGCTDYREIERGYLVSAIGISKSDKGAQIYLEAQTTALADKTLEKVVLTDQGSSISNAFENLKSHLVKPLYFEQLAVAVFDKSLNLEDLNFLTNLLNTNYGIYIIKTEDIKTLFEYDSKSKTLGYDIITLIKNFEKEQNTKTHSRLFEVLKYKNAPSTVNIYDEKLTLVFKEAPL